MVSGLVARLNKKPSHCMIQSVGRSENKLNSVAWNGIAASLLIQFINTCKQGVLLDVNNGCKYMFHRNTHTLESECTSVGRVECQYYTHHTAGSAMTEIQKIYDLFRNIKSEKPCYPN